MEWDSWELDLWIEHYQRRPFGDEIMDTRFAQLGYYIVSSMSTGGKKINFKDFVTTYKQTDAEKAKSSLVSSIHAIKRLTSRGK